MENCEYIAELSKPRDYGALRSNFISLVSGLKIAIQRQNIVKPATDFVAGEVSNFATSNVIDFFRDQLAKANAGDQPKFKNQRGKVKEEEIAQKSGLGKKPGEEGDSGQWTGEHPQNKNEQGKSSHEDTGPQGSERTVLIANDPNDFAEGGGGHKNGGME